MIEEVRYNLSVIPLGRFGTVADVAKVVRFLASKDAEYINGKIIDLDGGYFSD